MSLVSALQNAPDVARLADPPDTLVYIGSQDEGIVRTRRGGQLIYHHAETGKRVTKDEQRRIDAIGIPPAWRDVWVCPLANGYLQATGIDGAGRKQYRYHPAWRAYRERTKFANLTDFGAKLPRIRRRVRRVFRDHSEPNRELVTAALVRLLDDAPLRIGNAAYSDSALGASTLKKRNVRFSKRTLHLDYTAKGGKRVRRQVKDSRLLSVLEGIDDLPGRALFRYVGADGDVHRLRSEHVNEWLQALTGNEHISAKTFRTWAGSLAAFERAVSDENLTIKAMSEAAASTLRNTPAIARSSYIHPAVIDLNHRAYEQRQTLLLETPRSAPDLTRHETAMLRLLAKADGVEV